MTNCCCSILCIFCLNQTHSERELKKRRWNSFFPWQTVVLYTRWIDVFRKLVYFWIKMRYSFEFAWIKWSTQIKILSMSYFELLQWFWEFFFCILELPHSTYANAESLIFLSALSQYKIVFYLKIIENTIGRWNWNHLWQYFRMDECPCP